MQNACPDSRLFRPALAGLALTMLVAAAPAAAGDETAFPGVFGASARLAGDEPGTPLPELRPRLRPVMVTLGRGDSSLGLAYRMTEDMSLGAGGSFDPVSGAFTGVVAIDIRF